MQWCLVLKSSIWFFSGKDFLFRVRVSPDNVSPYFYPACVYHLWQKHVKSHRLNPTGPEVLVLGAHGWFHLHNTSDPERLLLPVEMEVPVFRDALPEKVMFPYHTFLVGKRKLHLSLHSDWQKYFPEAIMVHLFQVVYVWVRQPENRWMEKIPHLFAGFWMEREGWLIRVSSGPTTSPYFLSVEHAEHPVEMGKWLRIPEERAILWTPENTYFVGKFTSREWKILRKYLLKKAETPDMLLRIIAHALDRFSFRIMLDEKLSRK